MSKQKVDYEEAYYVAMKVHSVLEMEALADVVVLTGSLRRYKDVVPSKRPQVGDVDIVYATKGMTGYDTARHEKGYVTKKVADKLNGKVMKAGDEIGQVIVDNVSVDLFRSSYGGLPSMTMMRTGSQAHNVIVAKAAIKKGWKWSYSRGIIDGSGRVLAPLNWNSIEEGEYGIYSILDMKPMSPMERSI